LNEKKRFGKIVCFRDMKSKVDESIKLFSNSDNPEDIVRPPFDEVKESYRKLTTAFLQHYPAPHFVDYLQSEKDKKDFVLAFRDIMKKHAEIQIYDEFDEDALDLGMSEQDFMDFRSKYLDIYDTFALCGKVQPKEYVIPEDTTQPLGEEQLYNDEESNLEDIDFCLELLHSDVINVAYILELIAELNPFSDDYTQRRQHIIDTMIKDAELRSKAKLIDGFIRKNVDDDRNNFMERKKKADGTSDLEERLNNYIATERDIAINELAKEEDVDVSVLNHYISEYNYLQKEQPEIIQEALKEKHLGLIKRRKALNHIMGQLRTIVRTFNWE